MTNQRAKDFAQKQQQAASRSNCYGLLVLLFRTTPSAELILQLRTPPLADALHHLGYDAAKDLAGPLEVVTDRLREEYTRIFIGPGNHVSLYASVHHGEEGGLWGDSTVRVKRFVEMTGLSFEGNSDSIPDHLAVELELMQRLAAHEAELWSQKAAAPEQDDRRRAGQLARCLEAEEEFPLDHLCKWIPRFCDGVSERSILPFYREVAGLTKSLVLSDVEHVAAMRSVNRPGLCTAPGQCGSTSRPGPGQRG